MGLLDYSKSLWEAKAKLNKLKKIKTDLDDDANSINKINRKLDDISDAYKSFIKTGNAGVVSKIDALREVSQDADSMLINSRKFVQQEIDYMNRTINEAQKKVDEATNGGKSGGGGSW